MPRQKAWLIVTLPCMPLRADALEDQLHGEGAELARLMQVDVDRLAWCFAASAKSDIEMALGIAVDAAGVEAADDLAAWRSASSSSSTVPGMTSTPDCGKATISMSMMPR